MPFLSGVNRREFLASVGASFVVVRGVSGQRPRYTSDPFSLGVASGDPLHDRVILWTRLAPEPLEFDALPAAPIDLQWEVAHDERFSRIARHGTVAATRATAHCVHVDVDGLEPDREYWYRFRTYGSGGAIESSVGRTRTAPSPGAVLDEFRFAVASCQKYDDGLYTAHRHLANENVRMVVFLGDYIYEGPGDPKSIRPHTQQEARTLEDYRRRYALYRSDRDLQRAHQAFPWMVTWDDHELFNDYAGLAVSADPALRRRRAAAYQAFVEHMPIRARLSSDGSLSLHRRLALGQLATLSMLDTRQYRSPHACGAALERACAEANEPGRTILGARQERWLFDSIGQSKTRWQLIAQQIPMSVMDRQPGPEAAVHMDKWDGYAVSRERLLNLLAARSKRDTVVVTGDNHNHWMMELKRRSDAESAPPLATEFIGTSISSTGDGADQRAPYIQTVREMPQARYLNSRRGYLRCVVTPDTWRTDYRVVPYISRPDAPVSTDASFVLRHGEARAERD